MTSCADNSVCARGTCCEVSTLTSGTSTCRSVAIQCFTGDGKLANGGSCNANGECATDCCSANNQCHNLTSDCMSSSTSTAELPGWAIAIIVVAAILVLLALLFCICCAIFQFRQRKKREQERQRARQADVKARSADPAIPRPQLQNSPNLYQPNV